MSDAQLVGGLPRSGKVKPPLILKPVMIANVVHFQCGCFHRQIRMGAGVQIVPCFAHVGMEKEIEDAARLVSDR